MQPLSSTIGDFFTKIKQKMTTLIDHVLMILIINIFYCTIYIQSHPTEIKLSLTQRSDEMIVSWYSSDVDIRKPIVQYVNDTSCHVEESNYTVESLYNVTGYSNEWKGLIYSVTIQKLNLNTMYWYRCGYRDGNDWSRMNELKTRKQFPPYQFLWIGDLGVSPERVEEKTYELLSNEIKNDEYDALFHVGDISYCDEVDVDHCTPSVWHRFMQIIEPVSASIPYMICPGNHDIFYNTQIIRSVFPMPYKGNNRIYYSFNYGNAHFISLNSEDDIHPGSDQYNWFVSDLISYHTYFKNNEYPWLIVYAHRPIYCSNYYDWCRNVMDYNRTISTFRESIEDLLYKYQVDIMIAGHVHAYERTYPYYKDHSIKQYNSRHEFVPHLIIGNSGAENKDCEWQSSQPYTAVRLLDYGYGRMVVNDKYIVWEMVALNGTVLDSFQLSK
jgi:UDP-2,3-diacylglucosamine pyrophosphatase LpxH